MMPPCLPSTAEFQKRECRGYLGVNLKFMTSARSTVAESVTHQVCQRGGLWGRNRVGGARAVSETHGSLCPKHKAEVGSPLWTAKNRAGLLGGWAWPYSSVTLVGLSLFLC